MSCFCGSIYIIVIVNINWIYTHHVNKRQKYIYICVGSLNGEWQDNRCGASNLFICQVECPGLKRTKNVNLGFTKDQLTFSSFHVWYKYKASNQSLLDRMRNKSMTGMKFSWKVENASVIWRTNISEFGRSIQTPKLGEIFKPSEDSVDHFYTASLTGPGEFQRTYMPTQPWS